MKLLMPKPFRKNSLKIYKNFSIIDFFVFLVLFLIIIVSVVFIPIPGLLKLLIGFLLSIPLVISMIWSTKHDCRNYILFLRMFKFGSYIKKFTKKPDQNDLEIIHQNLDEDHKLKKPRIKIYAKEAYTDDLVAIEKIDNYEQFNLAIAKTKNLKVGTSGFWSAIKLVGFDITNFSYSEKENCYENLNTILRMVNYRISIIKISKLYDLTTNQEIIEQKIEEHQESEFSDIYHSYLNSINSFKNENFESNYYIVVYSHKKTELAKKFVELENLLNDYKFACKKLTKAEMVQLQLDIINNYNSYEVTEKWFEDAVNPFTKEIINAGSTIEEILAFKEIKFEKSLITINDELRLNIQTINHFPLMISYHWLECLFNTPSTIVMHLDHISYQSARMQIHRSDLNLKTNSIDNHHSNLLDQVNLEKTQAALDQLVDRVSANEEQLKRFQIFFVNSAYDQKYLDRLIKINETNALYINAVINPLIFQQFEAFQNIILKPTDNLANYQEVTNHTLAAGWPFATADLNDHNGFILGAAYDGSVIILDQFKTDQAMRKNHNMMILGTSGSGKSTFTKKLATFHIASGVQNIILDPESEYKGLLKQFGGYFSGSYYALGADGKTKFNPLQIQNHLSNNEVNEENSEEESNEDTDSNEIIFYKHKEWFGTWMKILFPELNREQIIFLESAWMDLYRDKFGKEFFNKYKSITDWEAQKYPIMSDLIEYIESLRERNEVKNQILKLLKHNFIEGTLGLVYNGYSNVSFDDSLIIFDLQSIFTDENNALGQAAMFIIISAINNKLILNYRNQKIKQKSVIFIDEAHLLLDKDNQSTIKFLLRLVKRIRKYHGAVVLTTQNPGDFTDKADDNSLKNILNNIQYSFFFQLKDTDIEGTNKLYQASGGLTEYEQRRLSNLSKGECLFNPTPTIRKFIKIYYNQLEKQICFTGGLHEEYKPQEFDNDEEIEDEANIQLSLPLRKLHDFIHEKILNRFKNKNAKTKPYDPSHNDETNEENSDEEISEEEMDLETLEELSKLEEQPRRIKWINKINKKSAKK